MFFLYLCSGKCECALFGSYVDTLQKMMGKSAGGLPAVIVKYAKIKIFRGICHFHCGLCFFLLYIVLRFFHCVHAPCFH